MKERTRLIVEDFENESDARFLLNELRRVGTPVRKECVWVEEKYVYRVTEDERFLEPATNRLFQQGDIVYDVATGVPHEIKEFKLDEHDKSTVIVVLINYDNGEEITYSLPFLADYYTSDLDAHKAYTKRKAREQYWKNCKDWISWHSDDILAIVGFLAIIGAVVVLGFLLLKMTEIQQKKPIGTVNYQSGEFTATIESADIVNTLLGDGTTKSEYQIVLKDGDGRTRTFSVGEELYNTIKDYDKVTLHYQQQAFDENGEYIPDGSKVYRDTKIECIYDINGTKIERTD